MRSGYEINPDPEMRGGPGLQKNIFLLFGPQFGLKIKGVGAPLDLLLSKHLFAFRRVHCVCF